MLLSLKKIVSALLGAGLFAATMGGSAEGKVLFIIRATEGKPHFFASLLFKNSTERGVKHKYIEGTGKNYNTLKALLDDLPRLHALDVELNPNADEQHVNRFGLIAIPDYFMWDLFYRIMANIPNFKFFEDDNGSCDISGASDSIAAARLIPCDSTATIPTSE